MPVHEGPFAPGTPCWADVMVDDLDRARDFYGSLFGWTFEDLPPEAGGYVMARKDGHVVAGAMAKNPDDPGQVSAWTVYLATDDVDDTAKRARAAGGVFFLEPTNVLRVGRIAVGADPAGAAYGLWQAKERTGTDLVDEPGALCWAESMSRDYDASTRFYSDVIGYRLQEIGEGGVRYSVATPRRRARRRRHRGHPGAGPGRRAVALDGALRRGRLRRGRRAGHGPRRLRHAAARRHPLRPDGARRRPPGRDVLGHAAARAVDDRLTDRLTEGVCRVPGTARGRRTAADGIRTTPRALGGCRHGFAR